MLKKKIVYMTVFFLFFITLIPAMGNGEVEMITTEDPETPLKGEPDRVEIGQDGDLIIVTYQRNLGISLIHRNNDTIEHIAEPDINSNSVYQLHYNEDDSILFAVTGSGYQAYRTTLETIWLKNGTIQRIWLNYYANAINDIEYNSNTDTLFLGCNDGLWIIDVESQNITTKLDMNSGLKPGGILDFFQEPTENLLWFSTSWTLSNMNIQTLDMSSNTVTTEVFNFTDIVNKSGYFPFREIHSLLYDTTTRDIYVAFQFNKTSIEGDYYLACFSRDDTSKFVPLPTWYLSQGREVTRSGGDLVFIESLILDMFPRNSDGDGPFFQGARFGLFYYDLPEIKFSNLNTEEPVDFLYKLFLGEVAYPSFEYNVDTEDYVDVDRKYVVPQYDWVQDIALSSEDGTVVITNSDGITITNIDETELVPEPYGREQYLLFTIYHNENFNKTNRGLPVPICRRRTAEKINATGIVEIQTSSDYSVHPYAMWIITSSKLTVTDSKGNVIAKKEGTGEILKIDLMIEELPSSEYTVRCENRDALGNLVEYKESKFILDNPNVEAESESDSKLASAVLPIFGGLCGLLFLGVLIASIFIFTRKKKMDESALQKVK